MKSLLLTGVAAAGLLVLAGTGTSQAGAVTGAVWETTSANASTTTIPAGPPTATFTPGAINYSSGASYTIGEFLGPAAAATLSAPIGGDSLDNTVFRFTGTVGLVAGNNSFVVGHDDGVVLSIAGSNVVNAPGPTGFDATPFNVVNTGPTGNYSFTLDYAECCGAPGILQFSINNVVVGTPEPATMAILGTGMAGLGFLRRRKRV